MKMPTSWLLPLLRGKRPGPPMRTEGPIKVLERNPKTGVEIPLPVQVGMILVIFPKIRWLLFMPGLPVLAQFPAQVQVQVQIPARFEVQILPICLSRTLAATMKASQALPPLAPRQMRLSGS